MGPYASLRDRIAAHRQPIGTGGGANSWAAANRLWSEIDAPLVGVLVDDVLGIWRQFAPHVYQAPIVMRTVPVKIAAQLASAFPDSPREGLGVGVGSFDETRPGFISAVQGGDVGERLRQIADTIEHFEHLAKIANAVVGERSLQRLAVGGLVIETCGLVELVLDLPQGRTPANYYPPLVEMLKASEPGEAALLAGKSGLDHRGVSQLRDIRDTIAAHVDGRRRLRDLVRLIDRLDPTVVQGVWDHVDSTLAAAAAAKPISVVRPLGSRGIRMSGLARADESELARPYGSG